MTVSLKTDPSQPNFPTSVSIPSGKSSATFSYTFANRCVPSGDPNNPTATQSPSPTSPIYTVNVVASATLSPAPTCGSSQVGVTTAVKVTNKVITLNLALSSGGDTPGPAPVWANQTTGGATLNADPSLPAGGTNAPNTAFIDLSFPGSAPSDVVPVKLTLLDENRQEHATSQLLMGFERDPVLTVLGPAQTVSIHIPNTIQVLWSSKGPAVNYSNRFILVVDAGCNYGQTEFWLDVWNWS
ncbi:MAG TPA: hypothetical protein VF814_19490 [Casimicrobiaceae bacterium]